LAPKTSSKEITPSQGIEVPAEIRKAQLLEIQKLLIIIDDRRQLLKALAILRASDHPASLPGPPRFNAGGPACSSHVALDLTVPQISQDL
jgi:hypothetical protein